MAGYDMREDDLLAQSRRIEGQVRGIARMVEGDEYCIDRPTQVSAATKGLQQVSVGLFDDTSGTASPTRSPRAGPTPTES
jgi:DNA-binding FrmR family transcriptional regulator